MWWHSTSIIKATVPVRLLKSTAALYPIIFWNQNFSVTKKEHLPVQARLNQDFLN
nr:hypothetical protein [Aneurinibacillus danicus]